MKFYVEIKKINVRLERLSNKNSTKYLAKQRISNKTTNTLYRTIQKKMTIPDGHHPTEGQDI